MKKEFAFIFMISIIFIGYLSSCKQNENKDQTLNNYYSEMIVNKWVETSTVQSGDTISSFQPTYSVVLEITVDSVFFILLDKKPESYKYKIIGKNMMRYDSSNNLTYVATIIKLDSTTFNYIALSAGDSTIFLNSKYIEIEKKHGEQFKVDYENLRK